MNLKLCVLHNTNVSFHHQQGRRVQFAHNPVVIQPEAKEDTFKTPRHCKSKLRSQCLQHLIVLFFLAARGSRGGFTSRRTLLLPQTPTKMIQISKVCITHQATMKLILQIYSHTHTHTVPLHSRQRRPCVPLTHQMFLICGTDYPQPVPLCKIVSYKIPYDISIVRLSLGCYCSRVKMSLLCSPAPTGYCS